MAEDCDRDIAAINREKSKLLLLAARKDTEAMGSAVGCFNCGNSGSILGNGSAQVGGSGRAKPVMGLDRAERVG